MIKKVNNVVDRVGMKELKGPVFYNANVGIRFEVGRGKIYKVNTKKVRVGYIEGAYKRAKRIYEKLAEGMDVVVIDAYSDRVGENINIYEYCKKLGISQPSQVEKILDGEENDWYTLRMYWDIKKDNLNVNKILREIVKADLGGHYELVSSVYFVDTEKAIVYHMYDDRGLDVVAEDKESIYEVYKEFNSWILDYDRKTIEEIFEKSTL